MENIVLFQCFKKDLSRLILKIYINLQHISLITKSNYILVTNSYSENSSRRMIIEHFMKTENK